MELIIVEFDVLEAECIPICCANLNFWPDSKGDKRQTHIYIYQITLSTFNTTESEQSDVNLLASFSLVLRKLVSLFSTLGRMVRKMVQWNPVIKVVINGDFSLPLMLRKMEMMMQLLSIFILHNCPSNLLSVSRTQLEDLSSLLTNGYTECAAQPHVV